MYMQPQALAMNAGQPALQTAPSSLVDGPSLPCRRPTLQTAYSPLANGPLLPCRRPKPLFSLANGPLLQLADPCVQCVGRLTQCAHWFVSANCCCNVVAPANPLPVVCHLALTAAVMQWLQPNRCLCRRGFATACLLHCPYGACTRRQLSVRGRDGRQGTGQGQGDKERGHCMADLPQCA